MTTGTTLRTVDEELIETVARAIHDARFINGDGHWPWEDEDQRGQDYCRRLARAAIEATRIEQLRKALETRNALLRDVGAWLEDNWCGGELRERIRAIQSGER